jgi:site-specific recombinase
MFRSIRHLVAKWRASRNASQQLDTLLANANPDAPHAERNEWLIEIAHWLHRSSGMSRDAGEPSVHARLRYLLQVLDRCEERRSRVARLLRATLREMDGISLLCESGMPTQPGFIGAFVARLHASLIPPAGNTRQLSSLVALMFPARVDAQWIAEIPKDVLTSLRELFNYDISPHEHHVDDKFSRDLLAALHTLTCQISSTGLSKFIRERLADHDKASIRQALPFFQLNRALLAVEAAHAQWREAHDTDAFQKLLIEVNMLRIMLDECASAARGIYGHLVRNGVSVDIVFQIERMRMRIARASRLLEAWLTGDDMPARAWLFAELIEANQRSQSAIHLVRNNFSLLARKVVESNGDMGEHYIARDRSEYVTMLKMAMGGGLVTVATVCIKFAILGAGFSQSFEGLLAGVNYAASFLLMHFLHFTLATKQPAMTAPTLARELDRADTPGGMADYVESVLALMRTQAAAIFGNVVAVVPVCLALQLASAHGFGVNIISPDTARKTIESYSLLGLTPIYAAFTGVLLWSSSLIAGAADNWFVLHRVGDVLTHHRRLRLTLGTAGAARLAAFFRKNLSGIVGNVALGMMLGMVPALIDQLTPFSFEVRHVTLSSGAIAVSSGVLGMHVLHTHQFWHAVLGIASMAVLNVGVSFELALSLALHSRDLRRAQARELRQAVVRRLIAHPMLLLFPPKRAD